MKKVFKDLYNYRELLKTNVKSVEAKVINDRKIGIKVALEVSVKVYAKDEKKLLMM